MQQIEQEVRQFVIDNFVFDNATRSFSNNDSFFDNGLVDSMGVLTLVEFVRDKYGIEAQDDELLPDNWDSVSRIANFVRAKSLPAIASQSSAQIS